MSNPVLLSVEGQVERPLSLSLKDLAALPAEVQIADAAEHGFRHGGRAVTLCGVLAAAGPSDDAKFITLHASADDFHASVPLAAVIDRGLVIYAQQDGPLLSSSGGPVRFFIPDHAACQADDVDECANVKFVDRLELSLERGHDNRPTDEDEHQELHERQAES
jgi:DMSO/TMAO reductase YedYZ molybdopterin-dependent catalytic subunit